MMSILSTNKITVYCSTYNSLEWIDGYLNNINSQICNPFDKTAHIIEIQYGEECREEDIERYFSNNID